LVDLLIQVLSQLATHNTSFLRILPAPASFHSIHSFWSWRHTTNASATIQFIKDATTPRMFPTTIVYTRREKQGTTYCTYAFGVGGGVIGVKSKSKSNPMVRSAEARDWIAMSIPN
jgi:hypothetical protein